MPVLARRGAAPSNSKAAGASPSRPPCGLKEVVLTFALCTVPYATYDSRFLTLCEEMHSYLLSLLQSFGAFVHYDISVCPRKGRNEGRF
jgi:hypothetical protein